MDNKIIYFKEFQNELDILIKLINIIIDIKLKKCIIKLFIIEIF